MQTHLCRAWSFLFSILIFTGVLLAQSGEQTRPLDLSELQQRLAAEYPSLEELYKHLHRQPELSFQEEKTAARIAAELQKLGFDVTTKIGGHGLVGVMKNGAGAKLLIRTDLDALPITEHTGLDYASTARASDDRGNEVGVMHACGHDLHMTSFVGTARLLAHFKERWRGTLVMIGQPAEERGAGARAMLADGLFTRFPRPDYCIALHTNANLPAGTVGYCKGYALANVDAVDITVFGVGGHGAYPHTAKDPIVLSAQIILALQTIVSREIKPIEPAVVSVGSIHGGSKHNIIPDRVELQLTLRSYSDDVRQQTLAAIERIIKNLARAADVPEDRLPIMKIQDEFTPATYNDPELTERLANAFKSVLGERNVMPVEPVMGAEDFGLYGRSDTLSAQARLPKAPGGQAGDPLGGQEPNIPICIFWLGSVAPAKFEQSMKEGTPLPSLHSPLFAPDHESAIKTGVTAMTAAALELLK
jgi:hippurate hydrolase